MRPSEFALLRLSYQGSYDWDAALRFYRDRAIAGVEQVVEGAYRRTVACDGLAGTLEVRDDAAGRALVVVVRGPVAASATGIIRRVRRMFDLDADVAIIAAHLAGDPLMASLVAARPWLRVFGGWDGFEVAVRSIVGQQVTVARARQLNGMLAQRCGAPLPAGAGTLARFFPSPRQVVEADFSAMGMPGARLAAIKTVAGAALGNGNLFARGAHLDETIARLRALRGIGDWTAHYIAMRACREPDAFPAADVGLLRGAADASGRRPSAVELTARAEAWRPWRAYAAHHLWAVDAGRMVDEARR